MNDEEENQVKSEIIEIIVEKFYNLQKNRDIRVKFESHLNKISSFYLIFLRHEL
jgi:hypothetical protein